MAKLIHILAASVGSGLVLGASIRLGEALGSTARKTDKRRIKPIDPFLAARLDRLEEKVRVSGSSGSPASNGAMNVGVLADVVARMDRQQSEMEGLRRQLSHVDSAGETADQLRDDLHRQLSEELDQRLAIVEEKLHLSMNTANREAVNAMLASIETRVTPRIARLESEINSQSAALAELRDCSLQSERSIFRLVTVLERTVSQNPGSGERLSVVTGRGQDGHSQDEQGGSGMRRPA
jgi:hypothetical protein